MREEVGGGRGVISTLPSLPERNARIMSVRAHNSITIALIDWKKYYPRE